MLTDEAVRLVAAFLAGIIVGWLVKGRYRGTP